MSDIILFHPAIKLLHDQYPNYLTSVCREHDQTFKLDLTDSEEFKDFSGVDIIIKLDNNGLSSYVLDCTLKHPIDYITLDFVMTKESVTFKEKEK